MKPTQQVLDKAIAQVKSPFTTEIMPFGMPAMKENQFIVSVVVVRGDDEFTHDYTFTVKTGKLVKSELISRRYLG